MVRQIGFLVESNFDKKPLVVVSGYKTSNWINRQITADNSTWNGNLFYTLCNYLGGKFSVPYKYIDTNVNTATSETIQVKEIFNYCGFDIDVIPSHYGLDNLRKSEREREILLEASKIAKKQNLRPYQIIDNGRYLITSLGGDCFVDIEKQ